jgi:DNA-binding transcriptional LysR family regulator
MPTITLEQWQALIAVVDAGGYAQAAEKLHKSQSAISYAVQKIESLLNVKAFEIQGRKAVLTSTGQMLYRRALALVSQSDDLERDAHRLSAGWEPVIRLAVEVLFPPPLLLSALERFSKESPHTRIELIESVLGGTSDALLNKQVDLAIAPQLPPGFLGEMLLRVRLLAVAHASHPLHQKGQELTLLDLDAYRHIVVRDSGLNRDQKTVTVDVNQRWTVSQVATSIQAVTMGLGFAWLPEKHIEEELRTGLLKPLPLREGVMRETPLYLILANPDFAGPGVKRLAKIIKESIR